MSFFIVFYKFYSIFKREIYNVFKQIAIKRDDS